MSVGTSDRISLFTPLLSQLARERGAVSSDGRTDGAFSGRLDTAIAGTSGKGETTPPSARALAESLNLEMLHTTLALAGEQKTDSQPVLPFTPHSSVLQSMLDSYRANQAGETSSSRESGPSQPLPDTTEPVDGATVSAELSPGTRWLEPIIARASRRYGVEAGLIKAVIKAESNFNPNAVSAAGARGLMQLMPGTARDLGVSNSFDPEQNVMAGTRFLRNLLDRYNGDIDSTLAAYNWGPGNVDRKPDRLPRETRNYLARVKQLYNTYTG